MEKVKITLCGSEFNLKTEDPERLRKIAEDLQTKIDELSSKALLRPIKDILLLNCLDLADENYVLSDKLIGAEKEKDEAVKNAAEAKASLETERSRCEEYKTKSEELVSELENTVKKLSESEAKLTKVDPDIIEKQKAEIEQKSEEIRKLEEKNAALERTWRTLKEEYDKSVEKRAERAAANSLDTEERAELENLRKTVATYERTFEEYIHQKNAEFADLNDEITKLKKKYADLNNQMSEIVNDGQMTL